MDKNRIRFTIVGAGDDGDDLRVDDFVKQMTAFKKALVETDRLVSGSKTMDYRIVELSHSSPITVVLETETTSEIDLGESVLETFYTGVTAIRQGKRLPADFDYAALMAYKQITMLMPRTVAEVTIARNGTEVLVAEDFGQSIDQIIGPDEYEMGTVTGMLHHINLHGNQNIFTVYPTSNQPPLRCTFSKHLRVDAVKAVDQYVEVYGQLKYKRMSEHPYEMYVHSIEVYPPEEELPSLRDLRGIAPDATGGKSSERFIRDLRNEWF